MKSELEALSKELDLLAKEVEIGDYYGVAEDLDALVSEILARVAETVDLERLHRKASDREYPDLETIEEVLNRIAKSNLDASVTVTGRSDVVTAREQLEDARRMFEVVRKGAEGEHPIELAMRIDFGLATPLLQTLVCLADDESLLTYILAQVRRKLREVSEETLRSVWTQINGEFQSAIPGSPTMQAIDSILPPGFFTPDSMAEIRSRIAEYISRLKPKLIREQLQQGQSGYPTSAPTLARVLSSRDVEGLEPLESRVLECLLKVFRLWGRERPEAFSDALRLPKRTWFEKSASLDENRVFSKANTPAELPIRRRILIETLQRLLMLATSWVDLRSVVEEALFRFKLGCEIEAEKTKRLFRPSKNAELRLQRVLSRFLVERGIAAYGKLFGSGERDIVAELPGERHVIETKLVRTKVLTAGRIEGHIAQLISYLEQEEPSVKSVLVLFNVTDVVIRSPRKWIGTKLWVLPVNLYSTTPSGLRRVCQIEEGAKDEGIVRVVMSEPKRRKPTRRTREPPKKRTRGAPSTTQTRQSSRRKKPRGKRR